MTSFILSPSRFGGGLALAITADTADYDLFTAAGSPASAVAVTLTISSGVTVYSTNTSNPALDATGLPAGSTLTLVNEGTIYGKGGYGAHGGRGCIGGGGSTGYGGEKGGTAFKTDSNCITSITNANGYIYGGGGGGGGGAGRRNNSDWGAGGGSGGGGAGYSPGAGGPKQISGCSSGSDGSAASAGTVSTGGSGSSGGVALGTIYGGNGTSGGGPGAAGGGTGSSGSGGTVIGTGPFGCGAGGYSIDGNSYVTFVSGDDSTHVKGSKTG